MARCERGRSIPNASASASKTWQSCRAGSRRPTPSGSSAFWGTDPPTHQGWRPSYSTRVRRSTWRELPAHSPKASAGLAVEAFDRGPFTMDERNHGLAGVGLVAFLNDDVVAVLNVFVDHRVAAH